MFLLFCLIPFARLVVGENVYNLQDVPVHPVHREPLLINISRLSTVRIISKLEDKDKFLVFEAHCRTSRILMSYVEDLSESNFVNSTGPALIYQNDGMKSGIRDPGVYIQNPHNYSVQVLALVKAYTSDDPVPGLCDTKYIFSKSAPFLTLDFNIAIIRLNFTRASLPGPDFECIRPKLVQYKVYQVYLPMKGCKDGSKDEQFECAIKNFSEIDDIEANGRQVHSLGRNMNRLVFASYSPMGSMYAVIAEQGNGSSVYALGHTYGCHVDPQTGECPDTQHTTTKVTCAICIFMGLVMGFAGHRFFITSQFFFGFYAGAFVGFILLNSAGINFQETFWLTVLCGFTMAFMVSSLWFFLGIPVLSVLLPTLEVGIILASSILFLPYLNTPALTNDSYYWLVFVCLMLAVPVILLAFTQKASILSCVIVGSTVIAIPVDIFLGTGLRFIFVNVVRRASVPRFHEALIVPFMQTEDLMVVACWLAVLIAALVTQLLVERRKPPFPPAPFQQWRWRRQVVLEGDDNETAPLLTEEESMAEVVTSPVVGYILGHRAVTGIPQASPVMARLSENLQGRSSSGRGRDIFRPPSPVETRGYYSPRQGEDWVP